MAVKQILAAGSLAPNVSRVLHGNFNTFEVKILLSSVGRGSILGGFVGLPRYCLRPAGYRRYVFGKIDTGSGARGKNETPTAT
jgi:hypothetical protein